jgi:retinol dehydrogenase 12
MQKSSRALIHNHVIVLTGATSGIGLAAARKLAGSALVLGIGRSAERCRAAEQLIHDTVPEARFTCLTADLSSQQQIHTLVPQIEETLREHGCKKVDVLINNAGMVTNWYTATEDGYETQFAVNHLAPFLLTHLLLPLLQAAPAARVLTTSSNSHRAGRIHWNDVMLERRYNTLRAYQQSKLANVMFSYEFNRRFARSSPMRAYAIDPGLVNTRIGLKGTSGLVRWIWEKRRKRGVDPAQGARTLIHVAMDPSVQGSAEIFWKDCHPINPSGRAQSKEEAARLWELSERLCGISNWSIHD